MSNRKKCPDCNLFFKKKGFATHSKYCKAKHVSQTNQEQGCTPVVRTYTEADIKRLQEESDRYFNEGNKLKRKVTSLRIQVQALRDAVACMSRAVANEY